VVKGGRWDPSHKPSTNSNNPCLHSSPSKQKTVSLGSIRSKGCDVVGHLFTKNVVPSVNVIQNATLCQVTEIQNPQFWGTSLPGLPTAHVDVAAFHIALVL
jgi:hypothetical protein